MTTERQQAVLTAMRNGLLESAECQEGGSVMLTVDEILDAVLNVWHDGSWSWWCPTPSGGLQRATREEAVADFEEWVKRMAPKGKARCERRTQTIFEVKP